MKPYKPFAAADPHGRCAKPRLLRPCQAWLAAFRPILAAGCLLTAVDAPADTNFWAGLGADLNWSTAGNWTNGAPTAASDTFFGADGVVGDTATINNIVSANLTVRSLNYLHQNLGNTLIHNTQIADGATLTVSDALSTTNMFFVGTGTNTTSGTTTTTTISGMGGILSVNAPTGCIVVRNGGLTMYGGAARLDMSSLGTFTTSVKQMLLAGDGTNAEVGGAGTGNRYKDRASCYVLMAQTNILTLSATSVPGLIFANGIGNGAPGSTLKLGFTNAIFSDGGMLLGGPKSGVSLVDFNVAGSAAYFRNTAGTGPQNYWGIGDPVAGYGQGGMSCTLDFTQGTVDAWVNQVVVGRSYREARKIQTSSGTLKMAAGKLVANSMLIGYDYVDYRAGIKGTVEISGTAELVVSNAMTLGRFRNADITNGFSLAKLDIRDGGSVKVYGGLTSSFTDPNNCDSELSVVSGSLQVKGAVGPFFSVDLNNSTLTLDISTALSPTTALCNVTNLTTASPITLNLAGVIPSVGQFPLIRYATLVSGAAGDDITGFTLPPYVKGYLSNNVANSSIDLVVTNVADSNLQITQSSLAGGTIQFGGTCEWTNASYRVIATTNAANSASWVTVGRGAFTGGVFSYADSSPTNYPQRFFRLVTP